jgi:AbrB family looped-hinge helix DNA binding protein
MDRATCKVDEVGRVLIPAKWRKRYGIGVNSEVTLSDERGRLMLETRQQALKRVQEWARRLAGPDRSIVEEFLAERREEAKREAREG